MTLKKDYKVRIVELDNKSRKGTYLYIKKKGQRPTYYAYNPEYAIDYYIRYYQDLQKRQDRKRGTSIKRHLAVYKETETGVTVTKVKKGEKVRTDAQKYLSKLKKQYGGKSLDKIIKKGIQAVIINDAYKTNPSTIKTAYKKLLQDLVLDKNLLEMLASEENIQKMQNRIECIVEVKNEQGETIIKAHKVGTTLTKTSQEMTQTYRKGEEIRYEDKKLENLKYTNINFTKETRNKTIGRIQITTILRKGK